MKYHPKTKPFHHQAKATIAAAKARNFAIFFEPRCGKSKAALDTVGIWALKTSQTEPLRVLILGPRIALDVWKGQIHQHYPFAYNAETFEEEWFSDGDTLGATYFFLAGREETFRRSRTPTGKYLRPKQQELEQWDPDVVIIDESHEYKRPGGVAAQDCWRLVRRLRTARTARDKGEDKPRPWVMLLSGTPNPKGWRDLFAQFRLMDETIFGTSVAEFDERHVVMGKGKRKWTIVKYNREKELIRKIRDHSLSVSADEAGLANEAFYENLPVDLPERVKKMYLELAEEFIVEWEGGVISAKNAGVKRLRLLQITGGFTTGGDLIHGEKLAKLRAYANLLLEQEESLVVYSRFTPEVEAITAELKKVGYRTYRCDGTVSGRDRRVAISSIERKPTTPTAVAFQHQAGSRSIELVGAAETLYYSVPDGWVDYRQTNGRTQGPNQQRPVRYSHLIARGTVDISVVRSLQKKEDWHQVMMDNPRRFLRGLV